MNPESSYRQVFSPPSTGWWRRGVVRSARVTSAVCAGVLVLGACGDGGASGGEGAATGAVQVAIGARVLSNIPYLVPAEQDGYSAEGLDVETFDSGGGAAALQALLSGDVLLGGSGGPEAISAALKSKQTKIVATVAVHVGTEVVISKKMAAERGLSRDMPLDERVKGFKGLKIGITSSGSLTDQLVRSLLTGVGLNPDTDASIVSLGGTEEIVGALRGGSVDVVALSPPTGQIVEAGGDGEVLISPPRGDVPDLNGMIYISFSARNADLEDSAARAKIVKLITGIAGFQKLYHSDQDTAKEQGAKAFTQLEPEIFDAAWDVVGPGIPSDPIPTEESIRIALEFQEKNSDTGPIEWSFADVADPSLAEEAVDALASKG